MRKLMGRWLVVVGLAVVGAACAPPVEEAADDGAATQTPASGGDDAVDEDGGDPLEADEAAVPDPVLRVVATVAPIADLVERVGGERVEVRSLVPPGADSHTYEPRPQDVAMLADVDAYVGVGLDLNDGAIDLAAQHLPDGAPMLLLGELALDESQLVMDHSHGDDGHSHADEGHSHGDDGHTHDGDGLGPNPHVWTSVRNAIAMIAPIAEELTALDPEGGERYASNAEEIVAELEALDDDIATAAATVPDRNRTLVTYHDAWTYFARDHGFEFVAAVQPGDYSEPSAAELRAVIDLLRDLQTPAIFGSEVFPTRVLDAIAEETDAVYVGDLSDDELPGAHGDPEHRYAEMMRRNAITIVEALGGDSSALGR